MLASFQFAKQKEVPPNDDYLCDALLLLLSINLHYHSEKGYQYSDISFSKQWLNLRTESDVAHIQKTAIHRLDLLHAVFCYYRFSLWSLLLLDL